MRTIVVAAGGDLVKIAEQLTGEGHRGRSGSGFTVNQVVRMLGTAVGAECCSSR